MIYETKTTFFVQVLYWSISQFVFLILVCDCNFKKCTNVLILLGPNPKIAHFGSEKPHTAHHSFLGFFYSRRAKYGPVTCNPIKAVAQKIGLRNFMSRKDLSRMAILLRMLLNLSKYNLISSKIQVI